MSESTPRVIKRYQNRKLYDTTDSCYVTLDDISELIKQGEDIQVIDNASREDLTSITLSQIIFEEEKKQKHVLPLSMLTNIVRSGGATLRDMAHKALESGHKAIESGVRELEHVREEVSDAVERLVKRGQITQEARTDLLGVVRKFVDATIRPAVENVSNIPAVQSEIKSLQSRIEELERRLVTHERRKPTK